MVTTRRSRNASEDVEEDAAASALDTAERNNDEAPTASAAASPTRRSPRRTGSNSNALEAEEASVVKKQPQETRKSPRKRRGFSVDQEDTIAETQEAVAVEEEVAVEADSRILTRAKSDGDDDKETTEVDVSASQMKAVSLLAVPKAKQQNDIRKHDGNKTGNELTSLIPGYVAPMKLDTSSLDAYRPSGGLDELVRTAQQTDASTAGFVAKASDKHARAMKKTSNGCMPSTYASLYSSFKHGTKRAPDHSAGAGWFHMAPTPMTDELKTDLAVIRNRNYLDPKRFYKSADNHKNKVMQLGTVIEGPAEFYSSRLTKKQRRTNLTEEIMADPAAADYTRNKYKKMQQAKSEKGRTYNNKKKLSKRARRGY